MTFSSRSLFLRRRESMLRVAIDFRLRENGDVGVRSNNGDFKKFPPPSSGRVWVAGLWARCLVAFFLDSPPPQSSPSRGEAFLLAADADSIYAWPTRMRAAYVRTRPKRKSGLGRGCGVGSGEVAGATGELGLPRHGLARLALQRTRLQARVRAHRDVRLRDGAGRVDEGLVPLLLARDRRVPLVAPPRALRLRRRPKALEARRRAVLVPDGGPLGARAHALGRALSVGLGLEGQQRAIGRPEARRAAAVADAVRAARERRGAGEAADRHAFGLEHAVQQRLHPLHLLLMLSSPHVCQSTSFSAMQLLLHICLLDL